MNKTRGYALLSLALIIGNGFLNCSPLNLLLAVPEFLIVLICIIERKYTKAVLFQFIFITTSFSYNITDSAMDMIGVTSLTSYNYAKFKIASIPLFFINNVVLIYCLLRDEFTISREAKRSDFYCFFKFLKVTFIIGIILAIPGFIFLNYFFDGLLTYGSYVFFILTSAYIFLLLYQTDLARQIYEIVPFAICLSALFSIGSQFLGLEIIGTVYTSYFIGLMLPYALYNKRVFFPLIILGLFLAGSVVFGTGGKYIVQFALLAIAVFILTFSSRIPVSWVKRMGFRTVFLIIIFTIPLAFVALVGVDSNFFYKLHNVQTLLGFFFGGGIESIDRSPYIRIAEIANILYEDLINPIYLILGRGFGGYYQDVLGLFNSVDISFDTFSDEQLVAKRYYTAHDAFVSVPMISGLIGTFLWLKTIIKYLKHVSQNYLKLVVIPFLFLIYYFDSQIGVIGTFIMFAAEYDPQYKLNGFHERK